jgi:outer membrane cobalamin receptor
MKSNETVYATPRDTARLIAFAGAVTALLGAGDPVAAATAQGESDELDKVVVTGSRIQELAVKALNSTTVITSQDIEAKANASVIDLLRETAGLQVLQPSGMGGVSRVFIRGGPQQLAMILIDGVQVNDQNDTRGATFDFSTLDLVDVERVEIVRGPQSAIYGSDALAGVVNFISKRPPEYFGGKVNAWAGGDDYYRGALSVGGPIGDAAGFLLGAARVDDGEPVESTTFRSDSVSGRLTLTGDGTWNLHAFGRYTDNEGTSFGEDSGGARLAVIRETDKRRSRDLTLGLQGGVDLANRWRVNMLATHYDHESFFFSPGIAPGIRDGVPANGADANLKRTNLAADAVFTANAALVATFGADYRKEDGFSDGFVEFFPGFVLPNAYDFNRKVTGVFGELQFRPGRITTLQASLRRDAPSGEDGETTVKLGALLDFNEGNTVIRANWGQGFKLPGFFSLSSPLVGNPDLRSEKSQSTDLAVTHSFNAALTAMFGVFYNEYRNLVDFDPNLFRMVNKDEVRTRGMELSLDYQLHDTLFLAAQATYTDVDVKNSDVPLRQQPDWRGGLSVRWEPVPQWLLDASWLYVGETLDSSVPTGEAMLDPYHRIDATATWIPTAHVSIVLAVDNLLDKQYEEAIGFPAVGRRARLGLRYSF